MIRAVILGGAKGVWQEYHEALRLGPFDAVIAVNAAGRDHKGRVDHWVTYHPGLMPRWARHRARAGKPAAEAYWTASGPDVAPRRGNIAFRTVPRCGGSSGLLAVSVARAIGAGRIVLCGVPMDPDAEHFDRDGRWRDGAVLRKQWPVAELGGVVKSMSGWTAAALGTPSSEWLAQ